MTQQEVDKENRINLVSAYNILYKQFMQIPEDQRNNKCHDKLKDKMKKFHNEIKLNDEKVRLS